MSDVVENLIVKCAKNVQTPIPGDKILAWKKFTVQYFKSSPSSFLD